MMNTATVLRAALFAAGKHKDQRRKDAHASPYINHPIALASLLANEGGVSDADVLCAALLHDTIEDTETTAEELQKAFGAVVTSIVLEATDDKSLNKAERKRLKIEHASGASPQAKLVILADQICNMRDILSTPPMGWSTERKQAYFCWSQEVVAGVRGIHSQLEAIFDGLLARQKELQSAPAVTCQDGTVGEGHSSSE